MKLQYLTPGPSELYFTLTDHLQVAIRQQISAISHRSKTFEQIFAHTVEQLRILMNIPPNFHIVFTASATEVWERSIQNLVASESFHLVNGSFSKKYHEIALDYHKKATAVEVPEGEGFEIENIEIPASNELICLTLNETSTGVMMPLEQIYSLRERYPDQLIALDAVSIAPYPELDFSKIDTLFFSVQKCFGLPAGLGVWILNEHCVAKAEKLQKQGLTIGSYHTIPSLVKMAQKNQTPETPNVLGIYLLGKVAEDMNRRTAKILRQETNYKAALLYQTLAQNPVFEVFVSNPKFRSPTVIVANIKKESNAEFLQICEKEGLVIGEGYGNFKKNHIRIANFPTFSKETIEKLADLIGNYR